MQNAMWLASVFGPMLFLLGLWVLVRRDDAEKLWSSVKSTPGLFYMGGMINLLIGLAVLNTYREWSMHLIVLVTLLGYVQLIRGLLVFFAHDVAMKLHTKIMKQRHFHLFGIIPFVWGIGLMCAAFCCM